MSDYDEIQARLARENAMIWVGEVERLHNKVIKQAATIAALELRLSDQHATIVRDAATIEQLRGKLTSINRMLSPGSRTMDELMRDMGYACDCARAALNPQPKESA